MYFHENCMYSNFISLSDVLIFNHWEQTWWLLSLVKQTWLPIEEYFRLGTLLKEMGGRSPNSTGRYLTIARRWWSQQDSENLWPGIVERGGSGRGFSFFSSRGALMTRPCPCLSFSNRYTYTCLEQNFMLYCFTVHTPESDLPPIQFWAYFNLLPNLSDDTSFHFRGKAQTWQLVNRARPRQQARTRRVA
jgi:hypothetical protein